MAKSEEIETTEATETTEKKARKSRKKVDEAAAAAAAGWGDVAEASEEAKAADLLPENAPPVEGAENAPEAPAEDPAKAETLPAPDSSADVGKATKRDTYEVDEALKLAGADCMRKIGEAITVLRTHFQFSPLDTPGTIKTKFPGETRRFASTATDKLTGEESHHVGMQMANGLGQKELLKQVKETTAKAIKMLDEELGEHLSQWSQMFRSGERTVEVTAVECRDEITQTIRVLRADTGAQVSARAMTLDERQRGLDFPVAKDATVPSPEPAHDEDRIALPAE